MFHFQNRLTRKVAVLALAAAPFGAGSSVVVSSVIGTPAAHASGEAACVDVQPGSGATDNVVSGSQTGGALGVGTGECGGAAGADNSTAAINVCVGGTGANSPGGGVNTGPDIGYSNGPNEAWFNQTGPSGQLEIGGVGIGSEQTGC